MEELASKYEVYPNQTSVNVYQGITNTEVGVVFTRAHYKHEHCR